MLRQLPSLPLQMHLHRAMFVAMAMAGALFLAFGAAQARAQPFHFVALGDTAYNWPQDKPAWHRLIDRINQAQPEFSIHVGDFWGRQPCDDEHYLRVRDEFDMFEHPLIYTPGDNEWTDCIPVQYSMAAARVQAGTASPADIAITGNNFENEFIGRHRDDAPARLNDLRRIFFSRPHSLGQHPIALTRQSDAGPFTAMVENARWAHGDVIFATVHVVGSNDSQLATHPGHLLESSLRLQANVAWIRQAFEQARARNARAVVLSMQASLFGGGNTQAGFALPLRGARETNLWWIARAIREYGTRWGGPVLLIHGDDHQYLVDHPFVSETRDGVTGANITRLQVFGSPDLKAVKVSIDPDAVDIFGFEVLD